MSGNETQKHPLVTELEQLLTVHRMGDGWYLGMRKPGGKGRVFGGQVIAQALAAAQDTVGNERIAHSMHAYFMRAGDEDYEITFRVERDFDGGTFSTRRIIALQKDRPILNMAASFQKLEEGLHHQEEMPDVPPPEELKDEAQLRAMFADQVPENSATISCANAPLKAALSMPATGWAGTSAAPCGRMSGSACATARSMIPRFTARCSPIRAIARCSAPAHWHMA